MSRYFKYFLGLNLMSLADQIVFGIGGAHPDNGFGSVYKWQSLPEGFKQAQISGKPIFLVVHKLSCPACINLKEKFSKSVKVIELSRHFVMINIESGSEVLSGNKVYTPDGSYVPRVLFFTSGGQLIKNAYNRNLEADTSHRYFYSSPNQIARVMQQVLDNGGHNPLPEDF